MFSYSFLQWILFFYIYCFIGWIIESAIVSFEQKKFVNRGFLRGPFLPLYGFGAIVILFVTLPAKANPALVYLFGMFGCTILEYFTGWLMESILKMKYWDYSCYKFNFQGRVCLRCSLFWGFLSLFLTYGLHRLVETLILSMTKKFTLILVIIMSCYILSDTIYAFRTAFDVNKLLENITRIKMEIEQLKAQLAEKVETSEHTAAIRNRMQDLKAELGMTLNKINFFNKQLIKAHPHAYSRYFNEALKEVRARINEKIAK